MELGKLKSHFEAMEDGKILAYALSEPFSWRGSYAECAFEILSEESTKEQNLEKIERALSETFRGYKGGEYQYSEWTDVHFENDYSSWSDGGYTRRLIEQIKEEEEQYVTKEEEFVKLAFI